MRRGSQRDGGRVGGPGDDGRLLPPTGGHQRLGESPAAAGLLVGVAVGERIHRALPRVHVVPALQARELRLGPESVARCAAATAFGVPTLPRQQVGPATPRHQGDLPVVVPGALELADPCGGAVVAARHECVELGRGEACRDPVGRTASGQL